MGVHITNVIFDNIPEYGFTPGTTVTGRVLVNSSKPAKISGISICAEGRAKLSYLSHEIKWFKEPKRINLKTGEKEFITFGGALDVDWSSIKVLRRLSDSEQFHAKEKYFEITQHLCDKTVLPVGESSFSFSIQLPVKIPSSFIGKYGSIKYKLKVKGIKSDLNENIKIELKVFAPTDLRNLLETYPRIYEPVSYREMKTFRFLFFSEGPLSVVVKLPKSLYISGETVMIGTEVTNDSDVNTSSIIFRFIVRSAWIAKKGHKRNVRFTDDVLVEMICDGIPARHNRCWNQPLIIPPSIQTVNTDFCSIIKVYNFITLEAVAEGLHTNVKLTVPVEVSPVPITDSSITFTQPQPSSKGIVQPSLPPAIGFIEPRSSNYLASTSNSFNISQQPFSHVQPSTSSIGFNFLPSAPTGNSSVDLDPPPPYPGIPEPIPNYENASKFKQNTPGPYS